MAAVALVLALVALLAAVAAVLLQLDRRSRRKADDELTLWVAGQALDADVTVLDLDPEDPPPPGRGSTG